MEPKKQKLDDETVHVCDICDGTYPYSLKHCYFCEKTRCEKCFSDRKSSETQISWEFVRIFFIGREKDVASPFYKERLPMDLFKLILRQLTKPMCTWCARYCLHYRIKPPPSKIPPPWRCCRCKMTCCDECWTNRQCVFQSDYSRRIFTLPYKSLEPDPGITRLISIKPLALICKDCSENFDVCRACYIPKTHDSFLDSKFCRDVPNCRGHKICYNCNIHPLYPGVSENKLWI